MTSPSRIKSWVTMLNGQLDSMERQPSYSNMLNKYVKAARSVVADMATEAEHTRPVLPDGHVAIPVARLKGWVEYLDSYGVEYVVKLDMQNYLPEEPVPVLLSKLKRMLDVGESHGAVIAYLDSLKKD